MSVSSKVVLEAGSRFDAFELLGLVARGGMANVWLARQRMKHDLETLVAIKTILTEYSLDPKFQTMFVDESRIACRIDHPNVARLLDVGEAYGHSYIVMEYVGGESLSRLRRTFARDGERFPLAVGLKIAADLCAGLHAAHELRDVHGNDLAVVHRDVSPQNVLLSDTGRVKLIDFGVAKAKGRLGGETGVGYAKGKARYMAPEQAGGDAVDRRADVWAVGALLYELMTGETPLDGPNDIAVFKKLMGNEPIAPLPSEIEAPVRAVIEKALQHDVSLRFATAAHMRDAIEDALITLGLRATTAHVEQVCATKLADRIAERRHFIEVSLKAADDRSSIRGVLASIPPIDETSSDVHVNPLPANVATKPEINPEIAAELSVESVTTEPKTSPPRTPRWVFGALGTSAIAAAAFAWIAFVHPSSPPLAVIAASVAPSVVASVPPAPPSVAILADTRPTAAPLVLPSASASTRKPTRVPTTPTRPTSSARTNWGGIE